MTKVLFHTNTELPLDAITTFGINAKPNTTSPFGYFGTGLKYAIAVILRHGGNIRLFIGLTEYEFYVSEKDFRGKHFQQVRMRKRRGGMTRWMRSQALPFTTELGKNWQLWQAYREFESNTRDENGWSETYEDFEVVSFGREGATEIVVECDGFAEATADYSETVGHREVSSRVFLNYNQLEAVHDCHRCTIYRGASKHVYYQGIRVYDLRNPSRYTYDFKPGHVTLSEDRSAKNIWDMQYWLAHEIQAIDDPSLIEDMLDASEPELWFETDDLTFYSKGDSKFTAAMLMLNDMAKVARSVKGFIGTYVEEEEPADEDEFELTLRANEIECILLALECVNSTTNASDDPSMPGDIIEKIKSQM